MSGYDLYVFILCLIVFVVLTGLSAIMITTIVRLTLKLITTGVEDDTIKEEYLKTQNKTRKCKGIDYILSLLLCLILCVVFAFSLWVGFSENSFSENIPTLKVVNSASMSKKHEKNTYLIQNNLNDHIQTFDLIFTYKAPGEFELELYDVVVYEVDDTLIVHRIVGIEEPNSTHPEERWFLCQGDAVENPDRFPVRYSQIKGIYRGQRIPFVGSFITFMQSPAGWLCILLVIATFVLTPVMEKVIETAKRTRYLIICPQEESAISENFVEDLKFPFDSFSSRRDKRDFNQKLADSNDNVKNRYDTVMDTVRRIAEARVIEGKKQRTYKSGNLPIVRLNFRGKTLNAYLGLNPSDYVDSKYIYTDVSDVKTHANYPMRIKLSSDRQARWTCELLTELCAKNGIVLLDEPQETQVEVAENSFAYLKDKRDNRTFKERLKASSDVVKNRYQTITELLYRVNGVRVIDAKRTETFKKGNTPIAKLTIKGKTLNAYLGLNPSDYVDSKYIYTDVSGVKIHANYPMRVKISSDRQARWTCELITEIVNKRGLALLEKPIIVDKKEFSFIDLKKKKSKTFKSRLRLSPIAKERYDEIKKTLSKIDGIRRIDGKFNVTYKLKSKPIVKFAIRGKTLNAYLGLNPKNYEKTKYIFTDVSSVKKYQNYGMRVKVSSSRQVKWTIELITAIISG